MKYNDNIKQDQKGCVVFLSSILDNRLGRLELRRVCKTPWKARSQTKRTSEFGGKKQRAMWTLKQKNQQKNVVSFEEPTSVSSACQLTQLFAEERNEQNQESFQRVNANSRFPLL